MHRTIRYDVSKTTGCIDADGLKITAFSIRTTDGTDEAYAAKQGETRGSSMTEELIRFSMVSYEVQDGEAQRTIDIAHPFVGFDKWSTKARNFVVAAWKRLSTPDENEIKDFFASASESA
jgi:hypothetical protein